MDPVTQGMSIWIQYGWAGLFAFVFLVQFFVNMFDRKRAQSELVKIIEKSTIALEQAAQSNRQVKETTEHLKTSIDNSTRQSGELVAYLKGAAEATRGRRP
jgi:hypothetical protein